MLMGNSGITRGALGTRNAHQSQYFIGNTNITSCYITTIVEESNIIICVHHRDHWTENYPGFMTLRFDRVDFVERTIVTFL